MDALDRCAQRIAAPAATLLGLDTAPAALAARLRGSGVVPTSATVRAYRDMVLGAPGLRDATSGIVVPPDALETVPVSAPLVGVRADTGPESFAGGTGRVSGGVDGLGARLATAADRGVRFAVWAACRDIEPAALRADAHAAARFAIVCQRTGLVPVVRIAAGPAPEAQIAAVLCLVTALDELGVDRAATVLSTVGHPAVLAMLPDDLGGTLVAGRPVRGRGALLGRAVTEPALAAWRGGDVQAGRRALLAGLRALNRPATLAVAG